MSSINRPLSGGTLRFTLDEETTRARDADVLARHGRNARTLVKEDGLRVTVVAVAPGVRHSVSSHGGGVFLLTVCHPNARG